MNLKKLKPLKTTIDDAIKIQDFMIQVMNVHPEDVHLLASEADADKIIKHVRVGGKESIEQQFLDELATSADADQIIKKFQAKHFYDEAESYLRI